MNGLTFVQAEEIAQAYLDRRAIHQREDDRTSLLVVLHTYGWQHTAVSCIDGEWSGVKGDLPSTGRGIPVCPAGHPLLEGAQRFSLGLVEVTQ